MPPMHQYLWIYSSMNTHFGHNAKCRDHFVYAPNQWETTLHCKSLSIISQLSRTHCHWNIQGLSWRGPHHQNMLLFSKGMHICLRKSMTDSDDWKKTLCYWSNIHSTYQFSTAYQCYFCYLVLVSIIDFVTQINSLRPGDAYTPDYEVVSPGGWRVTCSIPTILSIMIHCSHVIGEPWDYNTYIDGLVQERRNSSALAMELRLSCTNPSIS